MKPHDYSRPQADKDKTAAAMVRALRAVPDVDDDDLPDTPTLPDAPDAHLVLGLKGQDAA